MNIDLTSEREQERETVYTVNGEREKTSKSSLTVRQILEHAGFTPATDYILKSQRPPEDFGTDYDRPVKIHNEQPFQALHKAPTPTS